MGRGRVHDMNVLYDIYDGGGGSARANSELFSGDGVYMAGMGLLFFSSFLFLFGFWFFTSSKRGVVFPWEGVSCVVYTFVYGRVYPTRTWNGKKHKVIELCEGFLRYI